VHASKFYVKTTGVTYTSMSHSAALVGDLDGNLNGAPITHTGTPSLSGDNLDATEGSIEIQTGTTITINHYITSGYTNAADDIANPQIANDAANLSIKYECRIVYVVGAKTYTAAKEITSITD
jgi:hypothetical protein